MTLYHFAIALVLLTVALIAVGALVELLTFRARRDLGAHFDSAVAVANSERETTGGAA